MPRYLLHLGAVASNYIWVASHSLEHLWAGTGFTYGPSPTLALEIYNNIISKTRLERDMSGYSDHLVFEPRQKTGSRYDLVVSWDPYGGELVIWPGVCTWRYFAPRKIGSSEGELKFLHGKYNPVDTLAVREYLDSIQ